jgi:hypothetical protein
MRFIETKKLSDYIIGAGSFFEEDITENLAERLRALGEMSLQSFSIEHDRAFLREVSSVLNVVVSIIYHPHLSNKREEVIIRVEQAQQVGQESFHATLRDAKLWKKHDLQMIPEEIHYYQHEDELRIYENRFIGFLVDVIDRELAKFSAFYLSRLPTLTAMDETLDPKEIGETIVEIDRLRRKTQFIKNTHFYKEVSRGKPISAKIQPTNILLKDRLYRFCFKFYRAIARYEDAAAAKRALRAYYMILLFKELTSLGFTPVSSKAGQYCFERDDFGLSLKYAGDGALSMSVKCHAMSDAKSTHVLDFSVESERGRDVGEPDAACDGVEIISAWDRSYADSGEIFGTKSGTEAELIRAWLLSKINMVAADKNIYERYCPVCRSRGIDRTDGVYTCPACDTRYMFGELGTDAVVWFKKIREGRRA